MTGRVHFENITNKTSTKRKLLTCSGIVEVVSFLLGGVSNAPAVPVYRFSLADSKSDASNPSRMLARSASLVRFAALSRLPSGGVGDAWLALLWVGSFALAGTRGGEGQ